MAQEPAAAITLTTPYAAHQEDRISDALAIQDDAFSRTLVTTRAIAVGTLLVRELPLVLTESSLPRETMMALLDADHADGGMVWTRPSLCTASCARTTR